MFTLVPLICCSYIMSPDLAIHRCNHTKVNKFIYNAECLNVVWHERFIFLAYDHMFFQAMTRLTRM